MCIIIAGSKAFEQLNDVMSSKHLLQDISKLSPLKQTSSLESFCSVINHFIPSCWPFLTLEYIVGNEPVWCTTLLICYRLLFAAMHFNENFGRAQATTKSGAEWIKIVFPKQSRTNSPLK